MERPGKVPPDLNIATISSAYFIANLTLAVIMVYARITRRLYAGFNDWVASQVALAAGLLLLSWRTQLSPWASLFIGNCLLMLGRVFVYTGCIRFFALQRHRRWPYYSLLVIAIAASAWLIGTNASASLRSLLFSLFITIMMARGAVALLLRKEPRRGSSVGLFFVAVVGILCCFLVLCIVCTV